MMSSVHKAALIAAVLCLVPLLAHGQANRTKPTPKIAENESTELLKQAARLFESGQNAHEKGELEQAVELYGEALKRDPALWQAEFQRAVAYFSLKRLAEAQAAVLRVIEQLKEFGDTPEVRQISARVMTLAGEISFAQTQFAEAEKSFRRALDLNPRAVRARTGLAEIWLENGQVAEAIAAAQAALEAGDDRASTYALLGEAQVLLGQYEQALGNFNEALKREPQQPVALRRRAEVFIARNDLNPAMADLRAALAIEASTATKLRLAELLAQAKRYAEAIDILQPVVNAETDNHEARTALAAVLIASGQASDAVAQLEALIKAEPKRASLRAQLAELYLPTQPEKALAQYLAAAELEPAQPSHRIGVGAAFVKLRRFQEAVPALRQALAQNPGDEIAYFAHTNLATALFEQQDYAHAAPEYLWLLAHQRNRKRAAVTLYFLGICFDKLADYEQALKAYEQFLTLASADNQLEIDKVKLRLPPLQRQIKAGQGARKK